MDLVGTALVITACGSFLTACGTLYVAIRQQNMSVRQAEIHKLVNGMSHELEDANKAVSFSEGHDAGVTAERLHPMKPAGS